VKVYDLYPSRFLRAADIARAGGEVDVVIDHVVVEEIGPDRDEKPVMYFRGRRQGLVLNKTNAARLAGSLGEEVDDWGGQRITLAVEQVPFGREIVDSVRVRVAGKFREERRPPTTQESARAAQEPLDDLDDEVPDHSSVTGRLRAAGKRAAQRRQLPHDDADDGGGAPWDAA
jgi:hypothetical protein